MFSIVFPQSTLRYYESENISLKIWSLEAIYIFKNIEV